MVVRQREDQLTGGTVITLSPHLPLERAEQIVRGRIERDGGVTVVAASRDRRQVRQLRRLWRRMSYLRDEGGGCILGQPGPRTVLWAFAAGRLDDGWLERDGYDKID